MRKFKCFIFLSLAATIFSIGCSDKSKEQSQTAPPVDTSAVVDTTPIVAEDTIPAVEELPGMPPAPSGDGYAVQVASCTDEAYARYLVDLWKGRGYEPFVSTFGLNGETHYRVRLGVFMTVGEARQKAAELSDKYSLKTWIDPVSN
jgi:cell division septation protein DedD